MSTSPDDVRSVTLSVSARDQERIEELRVRLARHGCVLNKSEVVRLGLSALLSMSSSASAELVEELKRFKPGRPIQEKKSKDKRQT
jgi:hypothetical protein